MKKTIYLLAICFSLNSLAQTRYYQRIVSQTEHHQQTYLSQNGDYIKDTGNNLNPYIGSWIYNNNQGIIVTLKLQRVNEFLNDFGDNRYSFSDLIIITYKIEKNGLTLFDNLNSNLPNQYLSDEEMIGFGFVSNCNSFDNIYGTFHDVPYNIIADCEITKLITPIGTTEKISLKLSKAFRKNDPSFYLGLLDAFSIPNNIELTKI